MTTLSQHILNDDLAQPPASSPPEFPRIGKTIQPAARVSQRLYFPSNGVTAVESNVLIPVVVVANRRDGDNSNNHSSNNNDSDDSMSTDDEEGRDATTTSTSRPRPQPQPQRAYWIQRTLRKAIYGKVRLGIVLRRRTIPQSSSSSSSSSLALEPQAEWEVTNEQCAVKEMEWNRIRHARGRLAENPVSEVGAMQYVKYTEYTLGRRPQHVLVPLDLLSDDTNLYLISPFCNGGELFDLLDGAQKFTEEEARFWMRQIFLVCTFACLPALCAVGIVVFLEWYSRHKHTCFAKKLIRLLRCMFFFSTNTNRD